MYCVVAKVKGCYLAGVVREAGRAQRLKDFLDREGIPAALMEAESVYSTDPRFLRAFGLDSSQGGFIANTN